MIFGRSLETETQEIVDERKRAYSVKGIEENKALVFDFSAMLKQDIRQRLSVTGKFVMLCSGTKRALSKRSMNVSPELRRV